MDVKRNMDATNEIKLGDIFYYDEDEVYYLLVKRLKYILVSLDGDSFYDEFVSMESANKVITKYIEDRFLEHLSRDVYTLNLTRKMRR